MATLTLDAVACSAPDGTLLFSGLNLAVDRDIVGLVGRNGAGKSTLLHAIVGEAPVTAGTITCIGTPGLLRQQPPLDADAPIAEVLGLAGELARLQRIELGVGTAEDYDEADWELPARVQGTFAAVGLQPLNLDRAAGTLSGGERERLMLAALLVRNPDIILLDEPTNNLDAAGRAVVLALLREWDGPALVASHDRELLSSVDRIVELTGVGVHVVGGGWEEFDRLRTAERMRAAEAVEKASAEVKARSRERQRAVEKQARRDSRGRAVAARAIDPKIYLHAQQQRAERTSARHRAISDELIGRAIDCLGEARAQVERVVPVRIALPKSGLSTRHVLVKATSVTLNKGGRQLFDPIDVTIVGPERVALTGPNGSGKTSLIRLILGLDNPSSGEITADRDRIALLDQNLGMLRPGQSLIEAMRRHNPELDRQQAHAALADYGFRGNFAERTTGSLSGGERVRLALACLFSRPQPPQMLMLDEPTNNLDLAAIEQLEAALCDYDGAILCVSHDSAFRAALGLSKEIRLEGQRGMNSR